ncbi:MAG: short-chain dehydrogenase [Citrobacter freundii]|nr:MAG: short-chain dehydrogenase [Citrobacter freundii]
MELKNKKAVITGGASGIGLTLAKKFIAEGVSVCISDINEAAVKEKAAEIGANYVVANVGIEEDVKRLVEEATRQLGQIDVFVANAGIAKHGGIESSAKDWQLTLDVNLLSQVYAAKYVLPQMVERKSGYIVNTASAAGLIVEFHSVMYSTSKHACVGLSEWLAATYKDDGIGVSVLCPGPVKTPMAAGVAAMKEDSLDPEEVADLVINAIAKNQFMISTHEKIWKLYELKFQDYDRYIGLLAERRAYKLSFDQH